MELEACALYGILSAIEHNHNVALTCVKVEEMTSKDFLKGRIIRLKITCTNARRGLARSGVLLFKYEGSLNCKFLKSSIQYSEFVLYKKLLRVFKSNEIRSDIE